MKRWKSWSAKVVAAAAVAVLVLGSQPRSWAADQSANETPAQAAAGRYLGGSGKKFVRGLVNTSTGWMEVFKQPVVGAEEAGVEGGIVGFFTGIGMTVARTAVGVYDTATFLVPVPERFEPVMQPEFVLPTGE